MLREAHIEGYSVKAGMILLPGLIAQPVILKPGKYQIKFNGLTEQAFYVN